MLELIVLGQIPGTGIYLSFNEVALVALSLSFIISSAAYIKHYQIAHKIKHHALKADEQPSQQTVNA